MPPSTGVTLINPQQNSRNLLSEALTHAAQIHHECHTAREYHGTNVK